MADMDRSHSRPRRGAGRWMISGCCSLIVLLFGAAIIRWASNRSMPDLSIPAKPPAPSPNAFNTFQAAAGMMVNARQMDDAISTQPTVVYTTDQKAALISSNASALTTLRTGLKQEYYDPTPRDFLALFAYFAKDRSMARMLRLESKVHAERKQWRASAESDLDAIRMGVMIPRGAVLIGDLVGVACQAIGRAPLWSTYESLKSNDAKAVARELLDIQQRAVPYSDVMLEDKYMNRSALAAAFKDRKAAGQMIGGSSGGGAEMMQELMFFFVSKETIANNANRYFDQAIVYGKEPYAAHPQGPPIPPDPLNSALLPNFAEARFSRTRAETQNMLLAVCLALRAYKLDHGSYPDRLDNLVSGYLPKLPDDPFALKGTFGYRVTPDGKYVLYSIGPDGKDDGGKAIDDPSASATTNPSYRWYTKLESKGDIVAGVNK